MEEQRASLDGENLMQKIAALHQPGSVPEPTTLPRVEEDEMTPAEYGQHRQDRETNKSRWGRVIGGVGLLAVAYFCCAGPFFNRATRENALETVGQMLSGAEVETRLQVQHAGMEIKLTQNPERFLEDIQGGSEDDPVHPNYPHNCMFLLYEKYAAENGDLDIVKMQTDIESEELESWIITNWSDIKKEYDSDPEMRLILVRGSESSQRPARPGEENYLTGLFEATRRREQKLNRSMTETMRRQASGKI
ncbi:hypothetical protein KKD62_03030 [Patescibacteria group bacterium]|nr:hypothetical protein [Patescibacteria group bacterium]MBU1931506.1 hypothetical protein [Patescibacteria group bacterium]